MCLEGVKDICQLKLGGRGGVVGVGGGGGQNKSYHRTRWMLFLSNFNSEFNQYMICNKTNQTQKFFSTWLDNSAWIRVSPTHTCNDPSSPTHVWRGCWRILFWWLYQVQLRVPPDRAENETGPDFGQPKKRCLLLLGTQIVPNCHCWSE